MSYLSENWIAACPLLVYPGDWDLFAPTVAIFTGAAVGLVFIGVEIAAIPFEIAATSRHSGPSFDGTKPRK